MGNNEALKIVKKEVKEHGLAHVADKLGYRSATTVYNWIANKKVSPSGLGRVKCVYGRRQHSRGVC